MPTLTLISADNFQVVKLKHMIVAQSDFQTTTLSGFAIKDKRNNKLIRMGSDWPYCLNKKSYAQSAIKNGLFEGFGHYEAEYH